MASLSAQPEVIASAAADLAEIRSTVGTASAAAASATGGLLPAAADEVSAATATLFNAYAQEYQAVVGTAAAFHDRFTQALAGSGLAYAEAEIANTAATALGSIASSVLGSPTTNPAAAITTLILGASGYPIPWENPLYIPTATANYIEAVWGAAGTVLGVATPEGLYPLTGIKDLTFDVSAARGLSILDNAIHTAISAGSTQINIFGYSQSAAISSMEMMALNPTNTPGGSLLGSTVLNFTLVGDVSNPNGGLLARFPGLTLPALGLDVFGIATPDNSFPTHIYTIEYDGFADFPQYPLNAVSDLNAFLGIIELHGNYGNYVTSQAIQLTNTTHSTLAQYYIYPTQDLPLLAPFRHIPIIGNPLVDLIQPDLKVLVDLGYGSTTQGWSPAPPNVPTAFGVLPPVSPHEIATALGAGTQQGINAFSADIGAMLSAPPNLSMSSLTSALGSLGTNAGTTSGLTAGLTSTLSSPVSFISALQSANSNFANALSTSTSAAYATLLPTADVVDSLVISVPSYDVNLFLSGIEQMAEGDPVGGLIYALGAPVAADTAIATLFAGFEVRVVQHAASTVIGAWTGTGDSTGL
jgi:PE-PPE domain/PE family